MLKFEIITVLYVIVRLQCHCRTESRNNRKHYLTSVTKLTNKILDILNNDQRIFIIYGNFYCNDNLILLLSCIEKNY